MGFADKNSLLSEVDLLKKRVQALEAELANSTELKSEIQSIVNATSDLYFELDAKRTIRAYYAKEEASLYAPAEKFIDQRMETVLPSHLRKTFKEHFEKAHNTRTIARHEYWMDINGTNKISFNFLIQLFLAILNCSREREYRILGDERCFKNNQLIQRYTFS